MAKKGVLLDYVMPIVRIEPTPAPSIAYIRNVLCIVPPKLGVNATNTITECVSTNDVSALTDSRCISMMSFINKIYIIDCDNLDISAQLAATDYKFFTILIDPYFTDLTSLVTQGFDGVIAWASNDRTGLQSFAINNTAFYSSISTQGENMFYAFAQLLSASRWRNQQYIEMPSIDDIVDRGIADALFDSRISFALYDDEYGSRLAFFVYAGSAIVAPYIFEEIKLRLQGWALTYISTNQPDYNIKEAVLLEDYLQSKVNDNYKDVVRFVNISVGLGDDNFIAKASVQISSPRALWRVSAEVLEGDI